MIKTILTLGLAFCAITLHAQVDENLKGFFSMLTAENLDEESSKLKGVEGTVLTTWEMYSHSKKEYYISKADLTNVTSVRWTTKEEYDDLYPEDSATNSDADFIALFFNKGDVERNSFFTDTDTQERTAPEGYKETATRWPDCNFMNISFKNSELAEEARNYMAAYLDSKEKK